MAIALELTLTYSAGSSAGPSSPAGAFGAGGSAGDLRLVVWVRGLAFGANRASIVALGSDDTGQPWRSATTVPFAQVLPIFEALQAAHWPSPSIEEGMDSSDLWQQARLVGQLDEDEGNLVFAGMAVGFNGPDSQALRQACKAMLTLAEVIGRTGRSHRKDWLEPSDRLAGAIGQLVR
jgi:hypothetical protein